MIISGGRFTESPLQFSLKDDVDAERILRLTIIPTDFDTLPRLTLANGVNLGEDPDGYGGAIASIEASRLYLFDSSFLDNEASREGGALWRDGECAYIHQVAFRRNIAGELPGGQNDDYLTHMNFGSACEDPEVYTLSDS